MHQCLIPVNVRLKTTIRTEKASKIIRKAERDLLQARAKSINSLLGYNTKQRDLSRLKLASILPNTSMKECQDLIHKVSEFRHSKVKQRQINKFNIPMQKEGNITWQDSQNAQGSTPPRQLGLVHHRQSTLLPQQLGLAFPMQEAAVPRQLALLHRQLSPVLPR